MGIFGGTFDPVHLGHLRAALEVRERMGLRSVRLIPAATPPHRDVPGASAKQRLAMLELATSRQPGFQVDDRELGRKGPSYTVDTLQSFRSELGDVPLCLILGMDAFVGLAGWHAWERLSELAHLVVTHRPGAALPSEGPIAALLAERGREQAQELTRQPAGCIHVTAITQLDISATDIRHRVAAGLSPRYLLPDAVHEYVARYGLYQAAGTKPGTREVP